MLTRHTMTGTSLLEKLTLKLLSTWGYRGICFYYVGVHEVLDNIPGILERLMTAVGRYVSTYMLYLYTVTTVLLVTVCRQPNL